MTATTETIEPQETGPQRWERPAPGHGGTSSMPDVRLTEAAARFWAKVDRRGPDECWEWQAARRNGYGSFWDGERGCRAHRFSYELLVGPIPEGLVLDHLCRNPSCVNPAHLEPVTERENIVRGVGPTAINAAKTHCDHGHAYTPENTQIVREGWRSCRECDRAWARAAYARRTHLRKGEARAVGLMRESGGLATATNHAGRVDGRALVHWRTAESLVRLGMVAWVNPTTIRLLKDTP